MSSPPKTPENDRLRSVSFVEMEEEKPEPASDLYPYQCFLFLLTQIGYVAVVPSMLSTTFFEPTIVSDLPLNINNII
jgi:hypothetical protein